MLTDLVRGYEHRADSPGRGADAPPHRYGAEIGRLAEALRARRRRRRDRGAAVRRRRRRVGRPRATRPRTIRAAVLPPRAGRPRRRRRRRRRPARWRRSSGTGCCAPTATARSAYATGTGASSSGSPPRPASRSTTRPTSAARSSSPPTTTRSASTTATPAWSWPAAAGPRAAISTGVGLLELAPSRLGDVETMHAMTIHKSQGSQADEITVLLPDEESRLLTRELFYTAVTRAQRKVRVIGLGVRRTRRHLATGPARERAACPAAPDGLKRLRHSVRDSLVACPTSCASSSPTSPDRWGASRARSVRPAATSRRSRSSRSATASRSTTCCWRWPRASCPTRWSPPAACSTA